MIKRKQNHKKLEFKLTKTKDTFLIKFATKIGRKWMQGVTHLEVFSSVFNMTKIKVTNQINKNTFAIYTPGYWENPKNIKKLNELIEQRKLKEIDSDVQEVKKKRIRNENRSECFSIIRS